MTTDQTPEIPEVGDRVLVYQYTAKSPTQSQLEEHNRNPWQSSFLGCKKILIFECPIVCLRRSKNSGTGEITITITSEYFDEPDRSQGIPVPLHCIEVAEKGYGLPEPEPLKLVHSTAKPIALPPDTDLNSWMPEMGDRVHKRTFEGWSGNVTKAPQFDFCDVMWDGDKYPSTIAVSELRPHGVAVVGRKEWKKFDRKSA